MWLNDVDKLIFNINFSKTPKELVSGEKRPTKRQFLAVIMSVFDPLGFLTPVTIQARLIMQSIWASGVKWDEVITATDFYLWLKWLRNVEKIKSVQVNRCYQLKDHQFSEADLHMFCDASSKAFGTVGYWRFKIDENRYRVSLIIAKSKVVPLKGNSTTPRLELQAALVSSRLAQIIEIEHGIKVIRRFFWSDSEIVLSCIKKEPKNSKTYV